MPVITLGRQPNRVGRNPLDLLTPRERQILAMMAEGHSNAGICATLHVSDKTVESHVGSIFRKLDLPACEHCHRRVQAVLIHLRAQAHMRAAA